MVEEYDLITSDFPRISSRIQQMSCNRTKKFCKDSAILFSVGEIINTKIAEEIVIFVILTTNQPKL